MLFLCCAPNVGAQDRRNTLVVIPAGTMEPGIRFRHLADPRNYFPALDNALLHDRFPRRSGRDRLVMDRDRRFK